MASRELIGLHQVSKRYADGTVAVDSLDLAVHEGEVVALVGSSGCGKTTTLRMINRMIEPTGGSVTLDGRDVRSLPGHELRRGIGYVIQHAGLFPHRTVADNVATVPRLLGWQRSKVQHRVAELLALVGLDADLADRYPAQLSGGQQQRVGVARALAADPPVLLMDEPFGAVDPVQRAQLQVEFTRLQRALRKTVVFVTHDLAEAMHLADRVAVLGPGARVHQLGAPAELLAAPADAFVAGFLGADRNLALLALLPAADVPRRPLPASHEHLQVVPSTATARSLLDAVLVAPERTVAVGGHDLVPLGVVTVDDMAAFTASVLAGATDRA